MVRSVRKYMLAFDQALLLRTVTDDDTASPQVSGLVAEEGLIYLANSMNPLRIPLLTERVVPFMFGIVCKASAIPPSPCAQTLCVE